MTVYSFLAPFHRAVIGWRGFFPLKTEGWKASLRLSCSCCCDNESVVNFVPVYGYPLITALTQLCVTTIQELMAVLSLFFCLLSAFHLTFLGMPHFIKSPEDQTGISGGVASFVCQAAGEPKPRITWMKKGKKVSSQRFEVTNCLPLHFLAMSVSLPWCFCTSRHHSDWTLFSSLHTRIDIFFCCRQPPHTFFFSPAYYFLSCPCYGFTDMTSWCFGVISGHHYFPAFLAKQFRSFDKFFCRYMNYFFQLFCPTLTQMEKLQSQPVRSVQ